MGAITKAEVGPASSNRAGRYLHPQRETMPREQLAAWQLEALRNTVRNARDHVPMQRARLAATIASGMTTIDGFAGQKICTGGAATTYQQWLEGTLTLVDAPEPATPPAGATAFFRFLADWRNCGQFEGLEVRAS